VSVLREQKSHGLKHRKYFSFKAIIKKNTPQFAGCFVIDVL
jgi:hypothetical protein